LKLDAEGQRYFCVDNIVHFLSIVPNLPWILIGWTLLVGLGMPERIFSWLDPAELKLFPLRERHSAILPAALMVFSVGAVFQFRSSGCARAEHGGMASLVMGPITALLVGVFAYLMSVSVILLSTYGTGRRRDDAAQSHDVASSDKS